MSKHKSSRTASMPNGNGSDKLWMVLFFTLTPGLVALTAFIMYLFRPPSAVHVKKELGKMEQRARQAESELANLKAKMRELKNKSRKGPAGNKTAKANDRSSSQLSCITVSTETTDSPLKTQVTMKAILSGDITEQTLRKMCHKLYEQGRKVRGFQYHDGKPTHIWVYLYPSINRLLDGGGWVGMLGRAGQDASVDVDIRSEFIEHLADVPENKYGLWQGKRKEIFWMMVWAEDRAAKQAKQEHPDSPAKALEVGDEFQLSKRTPIMSNWEPPAEKAFATPNMRITVLEVIQKKDIPWYKVRVSKNTEKIAEGWINSVALIGQFDASREDRMEKQYELEEKLRRRYEDQVLDAYGTTREQTEEIINEGLNKHWPTPKSG